MNTEPNSSHGYLLLFRGIDWYRGISPEVAQQVTGQWRDWYERLMREGKVVGANPLEKTGKVVSGRHGEQVADGPFAEAKEAVGGYFLLNVPTEAEAVAIARQCPGLRYGSAVEVRPVAPACPVAREAGVGAGAVASLAA